MKLLGVGILSLTMFCSCIYEAPKDDIFYRTLWTSEEFPYGPITLEFLCGNNVSIKGDGAIGSYGQNKPAENTAYCNSLDLRYETEKTVTIIIEEAYRTGENMHITWHLTSSEGSFNTTMTRLKAYQ